MSGCESLSKTLRDITIDCKDNGEVFTNRDRICYITDSLNASEYSRRQYPGNNLALLYEHVRLEPDSNIVLISTHIDCVYQKLFVADQNDCFLGTFDNSATNAAVLYLMCCGKFKENVVIAFTGNEEEDCAGAKELVDYYCNSNQVVKCVIVCDLTNEGWAARENFTAENIYEADMKGKYYKKRQRFPFYRTMSAVKQAIYKPLGEFAKNFTCLEDAEPDETDEYGDYGFACLAFCLPCKGDMHNERGLLIRKKSLEVYAEALATLANSL